MATVVFSFLTVSDVRKPEIAEAFFQAIYQDLDGASLGKYGATEPMTSTFANDIEGACQLWSRHVFWSDRRGKGSGAVLHGSPFVHTNISFYFDTPDTDSLKCVRFLKFASDLLAVDFACVHCFEKRSVTEEDEILEGVTTWDLEKAIPNLPWAGCLGKPYIDLFGRQRLESAELENSEFISDRLYFFQLTRSPLDYIENYGSFKSRQDAAKHTLGSEFFMGSPNPVAPEFDLAAPPTHDA